MDLSPLRESLLAEDFDVEKHASGVIQAGRDIGQYMSELAEAEKQVDQLIQDQVSTHYEDLLSQATGVEQLEAHLDMMQTQMQGLSLASDRLRAKISEPYKNIRAQTQTLARLQEACDLLRRIIRILQLGKKLQVQLQAAGIGSAGGGGGGGGGSAGQEMAKAALSLHELGQLWTPDLNNLDVIEQDQRVVLQAKADVERQADAMLRRGMETQNQAQIGLAMQVFQNLSSLPQKLEDVLAQELERMRAKFVEALDVKRITSAAEEQAKAKSGGGSGGGAGGGAAGGSGGGPGRASMLSPGNMATFRAVLWNNIESLLDSVHAKCAEIISLQRLLCKKRDAVSHVPFLELLQEDKRQVLEAWWLRLLDLFRKHFDQATAESNFLRQALEGEYPKLLRLFNDLWTRLHQSGSDVTYEEAEKLRNPYQSRQMNSSLREILSSFERAYLSRSLSRLFDPVNLMFSVGEVPTDVELQQVFKGVASELNVALVDAQLSATVSKNVAKTIRLMCVKCEQILVTDGEASQVVGYPTAGQKKNVAVVNCLSKFRTGIEEIFAAAAAATAGGGGGGTDNALIVQDALDDVDKQVRAAIAPLLTSIQDAVEAIILTLHKEDFSQEQEKEDDEKAAKSCSLYMKELQGFLSRVSVDFLQAFLCQEFIASCLRPVIGQCIDQFVLHASLVRPLGRLGQARLASDCAQLELALEPLLCGRAASEESAGDSFRTLRAFRSLLFMQPADVPDSPFLGRALPCSTALHFLFSKAPAELKSPHDSTGWSLSRYSAWLDEHRGEKERLQFIQGALESYVAGTRARNEKSYAYPYPVMLIVLEKGLAGKQ